MKISKNIHILLLLLFLGVFSAHAQNNNAPEKKSKIGLVLSGGGAKGLAHIGTLKVIDSLGIKVDYIAGTSMGAIIGSLYASGYTGKQLDSLFTTIDFDKIISDEIPRESKTFYERRENERYAVTLPFKDFKVQVPNSLSKGQNIYNLLSRLLSHVKDVDNFNELPIPFFCIATNIETGEDVLLEQGNLPKAVNASGALPSLFAPVEINGQLYIDGGVTDNYPIEKLKAKGMDIIIGVDVQDGLKNRSQIKGAFDILTQINNYRTINAMKEKAPITDIYIDPDIEDYTVISFNEGRQIIRQGEIAAYKRIDDLKKIAQPDYRKPPLNCVASDSVFVSHIYIKGNKNYTRAYINGRFKIKTPGKVAYNDINDGINNLQATHNFSKINYELVNSPDGAVLEIEVIESNIRNYLKLGLHYDELLGSAALVNLTRKNVLFDSDIISGDIILGDNIRYNLDYYIDKGRYWSIGLHSEYVQYSKQTPISFIEETIGSSPAINSVNIDYNDWTQQIYMQSRIGNDINFTVGLEHKSLDIYTETLITTNPDDNRTIIEDSRFTSFYSSLLIDTYDNLHFPSSGWKIDGDFHFYMASNGLNQDFNPFSIIQASVGHAQNFGKWSLRGNILAGLPVGYPGNSSLDFYLGGYGARRINNTLPFYGYDFNSISGNSVLRGLAEIDYEIFKKHHITLSASLASADDYLFRKSEWFKNSQYTGYAIGYGIETFLGPIELKYSFSPQLSETEFYVNLGFQF